jgi:predicted dehydrogenase
MVTEKITVRAVCTQTGLQAKALAGKTRAAYCTTDYQEILKDPSIDTVLIGTRHDTHGLMTAQALQAGKHVFTEKPLCLTEEELDEISGIYGEKAREGLHLMVGFNRRFSSHAEKAKIFLHDRKNPLAMIYRVNAGPVSSDHWVQDPEVGGGRLIGEVCHFVDYMTAVCGACPVSVQARRIQRHTSGITEDQCILSLGFENGSIGTVIYTSGGDKALAKERFEAFGDGKAVILDDFTVSEFYANGHRTVFKSGKRDKGFQSEIERFVQAIVQGSDPIVSFGDIEAVTRTCILAKESLQTGWTYCV